MKHGSFQKGEAGGGGGEGYPSLYDGNVERGGSNERNLLVRYPEGMG